MNEMKNRYYDAHIHIPLKYEYSYETLKQEISDSKVNGGLIIINNRQEEKVFWDNFEKIQNDDLGFMPQVAYILDYKDPHWKEGFDKLAEKGIPYVIKLHPRISNITINDFEKISLDIMKLSSDVIIVDNWIYGPRIENHIGTELTIYLSEKFKEKIIVMAHSGGVRILETMLLTRPLKNVYYDLAETCSYFTNTSVYQDIVHFIKYTKKRIMFGSDYPDFSIGYAKDMMLKELELANLDNEDIDAIMYANAVRIYQQH